MSIWTRFTSRLRGAGAWLAHRFPEHVRDGWPNVLFVPALVLVIESFVLWLDAVDSYAFLLISNYGVVSMNAPQPAKPGGAVVVLIDQETHERRYLERSPLDRCRLLADLGTIYAAHPHRLAIDIDISPALLLEPEITEDQRTTCERPRPALEPSSERDNELTCQHHLYELILKSAQRGIQTVLMNPIEVADPAYRNRQRCWQNAMEKEKNVRFARADLPVDYGLVIKQYKDDRSFAGVVHKLGKASALQSQARNDTSSPGTKQRGRIPINPEYYVSGLYPVPIGLPSTADPPLQSATADVQSINCNAHDWLDATKPFAVRLRCALNKAVDSSHQEHKVVFFGAAYGADDTFLTPLGDLYGVEVQAAAYLSRVHPVHEANNKRLAFIGDAVMALTFGFVFASLWTAFYRRRFSDSAADQVTAPVYVITLGAAFLLLAGIFCWISVWLLSQYGVWLSPIPIAVGMLIDCFIFGPVQQGIRAASRDTRLQAKGFAESFRRFFWYDWYCLHYGGNRVAARWLAARRLLWAAIIVWALALLALVLTTREVGMRIALAWIAATMIGAGNACAAEKCVGLLELHKQLRMVASGKAPSIACGSLQTVVSRIITRNRTSGRRLEQDKPLDIAQAQRNLDSAMSDTGTRQRIEQMRRDVQDEQLRLAYEAAIFDEEGHYDARDLRVQQLTERMK